MSTSPSDKTTAVPSPETINQRNSYAWLIWKGWVVSLIVLSLIFVITASSAVNYDPDTFAITPMLPDGDFRTECDGNHVCQGLRAALNFYSFTVCFLALGALYIFFSRPDMVRNISLIAEFTLSKAVSC